MEPLTATQSSHTLPKAVFDSNDAFLVDELNIPRAWRDSKLINSSGNLSQRQITVGNDVVTLRGNQIDLPITGFEPVMPDGMSPSSHFNFDAAHESYNLVSNEAIACVTGGARLMRFDETI